MSNIIPFNFRDQNVRVIQGADGELWFVAKDVADILGYQDATHALRTVPENHKGLHSVETPGGTQEMRTVDEPGLYRLVLRSDKPEAEPFMEWVTAEVLPSLRKTGSYASPQPQSKPQPKRKSAPVDPWILKNRQAKAVLDTYLHAGRRLGTEPAMARAIAVEQVRQVVGLDFTPLLISNSVEEKPLTPTELGKELGLSARQMNRELEKAGFQYKDEQGNWLPTEKGQPCCTCNPYKSPYSDHTGYRILWSRCVLDEMTKVA